MSAKHARPKQNTLYLILLVLSCVLVVTGYSVYNFLSGEDPDIDDTDATTAVTTTAATTTTVITTTTTEIVTTTTTEATLPSGTTVSATTTVGSTSAASTTIATTTTSTMTSATGNTVGDTLSFPDTLFIGDSRTVGLSMYSKINGADFFAKTSLSSFSVLKNSVEVKGVGTVTLEQLLSRKTYKTVYIMLGINEIGYNINTIVERYETLLETVKTTQPNAKIIIQSTLHVREDKQTSSISNSRINTLNEGLAALADNSKVFYLDVNPVFDNANGAMDKKYSSDGVHFYSKYYPLWRDHLANNRF